MRWATAVWVVTTKAVPVVAPTVAIPGMAVAAHLAEAAVEVARAMGLQTTERVSARGAVLGAAGVVAATASQQLQEPVVMSRGRADGVIESRPYARRRAIETATTRAGTDTVGRVVLWEVAPVRRGHLGTAMPARHDRCARPQT